MTTGGLMRRSGAWVIGALGAFVAGNLIARGVALFVEYFLPAYIPHVLTKSPYIRLACVAAMLPVQLVFVWILSRQGRRDIALGCLTCSLFFAVGNVALALYVLRYW